jgi:hypothetical protein
MLTTCDIVREKLPLKLIHTNFLDLEQRYRPNLIWNRRNTDIRSLFAK